MQAIPFTSPGVSRPPLHAIDDGGARLTLPTRRSAISMTRLTHAADPGGLLITLPPQPTQIIVMQLADHDAHDLWLGPRRTDIPRLTAGHSGIVDVCEPTFARTWAHVDSLHIVAPEAALQDLTQDHAAVERLSKPDGWTLDPLMRRFEPLLVDALARADDLDLFYAEQLICAVIAHLAARYGVRGRPAQAVRGALAPWQVRRAHEFMADRMTGPLRLAEVAEACRVSISHFSRGFRLATGQTPYAWLQACRLAHARDLLLRSDLSMEAVAAACGFRNRSHFAELFRRDTGAAPAAWRREHR